MYKESEWTFPESTVSLKRYVAVQRWWRRKYLYFLEIFTRCLGKNYKETGVSRNTCFI